MKAIIKKIINFVPGRKTEMAIDTGLIICGVYIFWLWAPKIALAITGA
jgi:hypothetical protein